MGLCRDPSGILDLDFWKRAGGAMTWKDMYSAEVLPQYTTALKKCTYSGRPFGGEALVSEMEQRFQRRKADLVGEIVG